MSGLEGKVVIVTGAGGGLGQACVREFARQGASLVVGDVADEAGESAAAGALAEGAEARFMHCNVSVAADAQRLVEEAISAHGRVDALFNHAGIEGNGTVETCDEASWDRVLAVNLKGMFLCAKYVVPHMRAAGGGTILNTASVSAFWGEANTVAYNAAKGGVVGLTRAMAMDHGRDGIRVNCLCPGYHDTGMVQRFLEGLGDDKEAMMARVHSLHALGRIGRPEELARTAAFLLSDANPFMTGAAIVLDGGLTAGYPWL